ncbi:hypothetical protein SMD44_p10092 (plasmid) [Streptomyces alboflavus]|uniref:SWIM-type domain-containing protein n=1 Tax=Streptomyces alboflavus TaxID=67267 RepID=A0A291W4M4_9ACTN|nr:hypothetical protein SMD44_p10092 [Streptomyces alboflavus]
MWRALAAIAADQQHRFPTLTAQQVLHELATTAHKSGIHLYPPPDTITAHCNCPHQHHLCQHTAATLHHYANCLDTEPLNLLLLRGHFPTRFFSTLSPNPSPPPTPPATIDALAVFAHAIQAAALPPLPSPSSLRTDLHVKPFTRICHGFDSYGRLSSSVQAHSVSLLSLLGLKFQKVEPRK